MKLLVPCLWNFCFLPMKFLFTFGETNWRPVMDLILPTNQNTSAPVTLDTKVHGRNRG